MKISPSFSFKGHSFKELILRNKKYIKILLSGVLTLFTYLQTLSLPTWASLLITVIATPLIYLALSELDFCFSEVPLEQKK